MKPLRICTLGGQMSDLVWESKDLPLFQTFTYWGKETGICCQGGIYSKLHREVTTSVPEQGSRFSISVCGFLTKKDQRGFEMELKGLNGVIPHICHGRHGHVRVNFFWPV